MKSKREYLNGLSVWALALGGVIGWGCFIMPGTRFLPEAGPIGAIIGIIAASAFALMICENYSRMVRQYPETGGSYIYTRHILGEDHAFLAVWCLVLAYLSVLWANSTAISLMIRYLGGDALQWGFHYTVAGYDVYGGEFLITIIIQVALGLMTALDQRLANVIRTIVAVLLVVSVVLIFIGTISKNGLASSFTPAFSKGDSKIKQILEIFVLAPWLFVGFETVTHAVGESKFSPYKIFLFASLAIITGTMIYVMLNITAASAVPPQFKDWSEYVKNLDSLSGMEQIPLFYNVKEALGEKGVALLITATMSALISSVLVFHRSAARVIRIMAQHELLPKRYSAVNEDGVPVRACLLIVVISLPIPFLGRAVIGWNADVSTLSVAVVYAYISICTFLTAKKQLMPKVTGIAGAVLSIIILALLLIPNVFSDNTLSTESYLMLAIWSLMGLMYYWYIFRHDKKNRFGKSTIMWLMMLLLLFFSTNVWLRLMTESRIAANRDFKGFDINSPLRNMSFIQFTVISAALVIVFSLFKTVIARQREADIQMLRAQAQDKAKSTFLSNMSHEIRTPMNAIIGITDILLREDLPGHDLEYVRSIKKSGESLLSLINDILDFSKIESGRMELEKEDYVFTEILDELSIMFLNRIGGKPVELIYDISPDIPSKMHGDSRRIAQIMTNIVGNAVKYTDYGYIRLRIEVVSKNDEEVTLKISVYDSGSGIKEEDFEKIFQSFSQANTKKNRGIEGTGLGLAISRQLLELMGGSIGVESEYGKGSCFYFDLPQKIVDPSPAASSCCPPDKLHLMKGAYLFDNPHVNSGFEKQSSDLGLVVMPVDGEDELLSGSYDFFLTDQPELAAKIEKENRDLLVGLLQNPMFKDHSDEGFRVINKPLYFKNLCSFLTGQTESKKESDFQDYFIAPDARVLIADDMPINHKITAELLSPLKMHTDTAVNGREALEMILKKDYDIVFMDHMMPVMDGIEAVLEIRKRPEEKYRSLPVIALTANATVEAKKLFEESGFSDFIAKPVHINELLSCVRKWLPPEKITEADESILKTGDPAAEEAGLTVDIPGIDPKAGIANSGGPALFTGLLGDVSGIIDEKCEMIENDMQQDDLKDYTTQVHALKTTCRMIGAMALSEAFFTLEKLGSNGEREKIAEYTPSVLADFRALKLYLEAYAEKKAEPDKAYDPEAVRALLRKLMAAIREFDLGEAEECMRTIGTYRFEEGINEKMEGLAQLVSDLDYDEAVNTAEELLNTL